MSMFKVGDRVVCTRDSWNKGIKGLNGTLVLVGEGWVSVEFDVNMRGHNASGFGRDGHCWNVHESHLELLHPTDHKILITTDGKTTLARLYEDNKVVKRAEAKCAPGDEFKFEIGANLAYNRLMFGTDYHPGEVAFRPQDKPKEDKPEPDKQEPIKLYCVKDHEPGEWYTKGKVYEVRCTPGTRREFSITTDDGYVCHYESLADEQDDERPMSDFLVPLVNRPAKVGEWVYINAARHTSGRYENGDIMKVECVYSGGDFINERERGVFGTEYLVLDGYQPEPEQPEYYSGEVVCVRKGNQPWWTVGKPYSVTNGVIADDDGDHRSHLRSVAHLNERLEGNGIGFIEFKG